MYIYLSTVYIHLHSHLYLKTIPQHNCQMVGNFISLPISLSISLSFCLSPSVWVVWPADLLLSLLFPASRSILPLVANFTLFPRRWGRRRSDDFFRSRLHLASAAYSSSFLSTYCCVFPLSAFPIHPGSHFPSLVFLTHPSRFLSLVLSFSLCDRL